MRGFHFVWAWGWFELIFQYYASFSSLLRGLVVLSVVILVTGVPFVPEAVST